MIINKKKPSGSFISYMSDLVKHEGGINLAQGLPGFEPPSPLLEIYKDLAFSKFHQYAPGSGDSLLLEMLVEQYNDYGFEEENLLVTTGATGAITLIFTYLCQKLSESFSVLAFEPVYESYMQLPLIFHKDFVSFFLGEKECVDFSKLEHEITKKNVRVIFLATPGNPYGKVWSKDEFTELLALVKKYNIYLIIDAVYKELYFEEKPFIPFSEVRENVFYVNSFSKPLSITGWRIGYLIADKIHMSALKKINDFTNVSSPHVFQRAIGRYLNEHNFGCEYLESIRKNIKSSYLFMEKRLQKLGFKVPKAGGGYFIWAKLPYGYKDGFDFGIDLYDEERVAIVPGENFSQTLTDYIRLNIARPKEQVEEAANRLERFFQV